MSVHGEYARALESVIDALRASEMADAETWRKGFASARLDGQPDLSSAARAALEPLDAIATAREVPSRLSVVADHLDRHCRVILGLPPR